MFRLTDTSPLDVSISSTLAPTSTHPILNLIPSHSPSDDIDMVGLGIHVALQLWIESNGFQLDSLLLLMELHCSGRGITLHCTAQVLALERSNELNRGRGHRRTNEYCVFLSWSGVPDRPGTLPSLLIGEKWMLLG